jgi:hypothetical protein
MASLWSTGKRLCGTRFEHAGGRRSNSGDTRQGALVVPLDDVDVSSRRLAYAARLSLQAGRGRCPHSQRCYSIEDAVSCIVDPGRRAAIRRAAIRHAAKVTPGGRTLRKVMGYSYADNE